MYVVTGRNVNAIYPAVVELMRREGRRAESRNGPVLVLDRPFCAVYEKPAECVLLDPDRRANPFLHLMECTWHMGARRDAAFLNHYVRDFGARFANEHGNLDGAYGVRWRNHFYAHDAEGPEAPFTDQIMDVVLKLAKNPDDRRVVIQMWDPEIDNDPATRDACCNQQLFPRIVNGALDMTVTCRSNDAIWGALGANCVHFPFLQQFMAGMLGIPVGRFFQVSNNYHVYEEAFSKISNPRPALLDPYLRGEVAPAPIMSDPETWDDELDAFLNWHDAVWAGTRDSLPGYVYKNSWFAETAQNMVLAFWSHRQGDPDSARRWAEQVGATDWRAGAVLWLDQAAIRAAKREAGAVTPENTSDADVRPA